MPDRTAAYSSRMRRATTTVIALAAVVFSACGSSGVTTTRAPAPPAGPCASAPGPHGTPGRMGECVQQRFGFSRPQRAAPGGAQGLDIANFQGFPDLAAAKRAGLRFLIGQSNDGASFVDFNFVTNWIRARRLGIPHGAYVFARPGCASCQAALLARQVRRAGGMDANALPPTIDAEVPGAYCNVAPIASWLRRDLHVSRVLTYTSPGLWACGSSNGGTLLWAAIWGQSAFAFSGWSRFYVQQYCGVRCHFPGVSGEVDRDVDHGVLALLHVGPPCRRACQRGRARRQLAAHERILRDTLTRRRVLRRVLASYGCRRRVHVHQHLGPRCRRWFAEGRAGHRTERHERKWIAQLRRELG
jgi:hypothetical protein